MSERLSLNLGIVVAIAIALSTIVFADRVVAQTACPPGSVAITDATRAAATAAGLPSSVSCWNPSNPDAGQAAGDAKLYLQQHATNGANISCLNAHFAQQLQNMMQAIPSNLGTVLIDSAYRSPAQQAALSSSATRVGACGSYHNYGLAADFNFSGKQVIQWIRANASNFGLAVIGNPTTGCFSSGFCDPAHVQEAGPLPPSSQCGICSSNVVGTQTAPQTSTTGITSDNFLYTPASGTQIPAGYCLASTQPLIYTPCNAASYAAQTAQLPAQPLQTQPAPITQSAQPTQTTPAAATTPSPATPLATSSLYNPLSPLLQTQPIAFAASTSPSALSFLQQIANPTSASPGQAAIQTFLSTTSDIYTIVQGDLASRTSSGASASSLVDTTNYEQQTLTMSGGQPLYTGTSTSPLSGLFGALQNVLGNLLTYLRSLGS